LTRDPDGTFQLREKDGVIYRFHSDLRLNYIQDLNGNRINANYDGSNRLIKIVHSSGQSFSFEYNDAGRIVHLIDSVGRVTTYEYDADHGLLLRVIDPSGAATEYLYSLGQGDALNFRLLSVTYPDGTHTHYEYNAQGHLVRRAGTSGLNPVAYGYSPDGLTSIVDATGGEMKVRVNDRGQPVAAIDPHGGLTQYEYDAAANLAKTIDPLGRATQFFYDEFGNLTQATNPLGEAIKLGYDLRFNKPAWVLDPLGNGTAFAYDPQGNLQKTVFPDSTQQNYAYDPQGNLVAFQDGAGITTEFAYNAQGRMMARRDALGNLTQFAYDAAGDPQTVTDAMGRVVSNSRDVLGRLLRRTYPDGSHEDYEYDAASKITAFINRRGERITFAYDVAGHLEWKTYPSGRAWHYLYDAAGYLVRVEEVVGGNAALVVAYEYDASHRVTKARVPGKSPQETYDVSYAYDPAGNRTQMIYPDGVVLNYGYDAANRLIWIADAGDNPIVTYGYDAAGRRINRVLGNRTITGYLYDTLNRLIEVGNYSPEMAPQSRFAYTYNPAGMRTSMTTLEGTHNYDYDPTYQLTDVSYPDGRKVGYAFDPVGNRTGVNDNGNVTGYATNALDQYTQAGSETFGYDGNGNLTARAGGNVTSYAWDEDDHLIGVNRNGVAIGYHYDHQGRLAAKAINGQETRYVWDGIHIIAEMDSAGNIVKRYIYGPTIDEILIVTANGTNYWAQQDGLGSVVGATDNSGALIVAISYDVYGNIRSGDLGPVPQRFAGMWWDGDAGLYYVRATWYEPTLGRFLSIDPIRAIQEKVLYSYAENNPINLGFG
jgi:RHS repeat-associated protein